MKTVVLKRMAQRMWRPALAITGIVGAMIAVSELAALYLGWNSFVVYWGLFAAISFVFVLKSAYDWTAIEIEYEQQQMIKDIKRD